MGKEEDFYIDIKRKSIQDREKHLLQTFQHGDIVEQSHNSQRRSLRKIEDEVREGAQGISSLLGMLVCVVSGIQSHYMFCR